MNCTGKQVLAQASHVYGKVPYSILVKRWDEAMTRFDALCALPVDRRPVVEIVTLSDEIQSLCRELVGRSYRSAA